MTRFRQLVAEILDKLSKQAILVECMVQKGLEALERKSGIAHEVEALEREVNSQEIEIEESCLEVLALFQPTASDLRILSTILKANGELERIGDLALNLAERAEALSEYPGVNVPHQLEEMVRYSLKMLMDADQSLAEKNVKLARDVCRRDDQLDAMNRELIVEIAGTMENNPSQVKAQLHIFSASRIIERIGDHATNIAEDVLYLVEGEIQRHRFKLNEDSPQFPSVEGSGQNLDSFETN